MGQWDIDINGNNETQNTIHLLMTLDLLACSKTNLKLLLLYWSGLSADVQSPHSPTNLSSSQHRGGNFKHKHCDDNKAQYVVLNMLSHAFH